MMKSGVGWTHEAQPTGPFQRNLKSERILFTSSASPGSPVDLRTHCRASSSNPAASRSDAIASQAFSGWSGFNDQWMERSVNFM